MGFVEFRELCQYAQSERGVTVFYDRFIQLCDQKGVAPSRAAIEAGISKSLVTKWKTNASKDPSPDVLRKLANYFDMTVSDLLDETKTPTPKGELDILDEVDVAFYGDYKELTEDDKETLRAMARVMRERRKNKG